LLLTFPAYLVRKLIWPLVTLTRAITKFPPTLEALTAAGRPAPSINQNIPRIAHTAISTARITDVRKISATAAPVIKVSICPSRSNVQRQTKMHATHQLKNIDLQGNLAIHRQEQRVTQNTLWARIPTRKLPWHRLQPVSIS
jgi:hypothetical protein